MQDAFWVEVAVEQQCKTVAVNHAQGPSSVSSASCHACYLGTAAGHPHSTSLHPGLRT